MLTYVTVFLAFCTCGDARRLQQAARPGLAAQVTSVEDLKAAILSNTLNVELVANVALDTAIFPGTSCSTMLFVDACDVLHPPTLTNGVALIV
jgi:hypothetical protein